MPTIPAAYAPNDYEVAHAKRVIARHQKAKESARAEQPRRILPFSVPKKKQKKTVKEDKKNEGRAGHDTAARRQAVQPGRFDHLKPAAIIEAPVAVQIASPSVQRAEKVAADRRDRADLHRFGHVRSEAERRAEDAQADRFAREAVALVEGRR